jgi:hypothetical protein
MLVCFFARRVEVKKYGWSSLSCGAVLRQSQPGWWKLQSKVTPERKSTLGRNALSLGPSLLSLIGLEQLGNMVDCLHVAVETKMVTTGGCEPTAFLGATDILRTCSVSPSLPLKSLLNFSLCPYFCF